MLFDQSEYALRCEWGAQGVAQLAPISDVLIVVDVLSPSHHNTRTGYCMIHSSGVRIAKPFTIA